jgi:predicted DNA-binding ArsR family transcriptional regulator
MSINFYFDESGYKGYLNERPNDSDFCLVAGFSINSDAVQEFSTELKDIFKDVYINPGEKFHATDIFKDNKNQVIKNRFISLIKKKRNLQILHSAIYSIGFFNNNENNNRLNKITIESIATSKIKPSGVHSNENIYHAAFTDIIIKIDELCSENNINKLNLITDRVDENIKKECQKILNNINKNETTMTTTGYDTINKVVVHGSINTKIQGFDLGVSHIKELQIDYLNSELTIAADIITNLIFRHIKFKIDNGFIDGLNGTAIFDDFELKDKIAYLDDENLLDKIYKK